MRRRTLMAAVTAVALAGGAGAVALGSARGSSTTVQVQDLRVEGVPEPGAAAASLEARLYLPHARTPLPAILLAPGFGGTEDELSGDAQWFAQRGYVVLTYTPRGFGRSGGSIHLDAPGYEVADARRLVDVLASRPEVRKDRAGDPVVGVSGASYGGALALLLAAADPRVDAIVPMITWNDLGQALFPQSAVQAGSDGSPAAVRPISQPGVFKRVWAGVFFGSGTTALPGTGESSATRSGAGALTAADPGCGRFAPDLCAAYREAATSGRSNARIQALLEASSPAPVLGRIHAPTMLIQGEADSLFPLSEADANARGIAAAGTPVRVVWYGGGHDGGTDEASRLRSLTRGWFDHYLQVRQGNPDLRFEVTVPDATLSTQDTAPAPIVRAASRLPGIDAGSGTTEHRALPLSGPVQDIQSPAGATPAALSTVPGLGSVLGLLSAGGSQGFGSSATGAGGANGLVASLSALPGQSASFETTPLKEPLSVVGSSRVTLRVTSTARDLTLFGQLYDVAEDGGATLPERLVAPLRLDVVPGAAQTVTLALPAVVRDVPAGHRLRLVLSATDQGYAMPADPRQYTVALAGDQALWVPTVPMSVLGSGDLGPVLPWAVALGIVLLLGAAAGAVISRRRRAITRDPALADVPMAVLGLGKAYGDGFRAVSDLSFHVEQGQVLGLLGPNGAGKTTTLRMLMGLIRPTEGEVRVFGHRIVPGAPVLSRVGAFVEGDGFLPHVSGLENLHLYWRATGGELVEAHLEEVLEIAGLGEDVHRRVRTYSHGMRQRLAIAQAMLGLPDLLVLDEPTNGLDPPQIREMREVLARYAATGRTVVVSSHLLAEVEQTCTHVVLMNRGRLVTQGPVAELVGSATSLVVGVDDPARAAEVAAGVDGAQDIEVTDSGLTLRLVGTSRAELVRALVLAGLAVDRITPEHGLEEAFLALVGEV